MSLFNGLLCGDPDDLYAPPRVIPYEEEPTFHEPSGLWLYGNLTLLRTDLDYVDEILGKSHFYPTELDAIEREAQRMVLAGKILVCGVHNEGHMRAAIVPLRWGSPRIVVFSGGFEFHLGKDLKEEPFRTARLWRFEWDRRTDLAVSRRAPEKRPTYAFNNPTVDRLITEIAAGTKEELDALITEFAPSKA